MASPEIFQDELRETLSELTIEWKISNFLSLTQEQGCYYQSSVFEFAGSLWNFTFFPGGDYTIQDEPKDFISIYLESSNLKDPPITVTYTFGLKTANGVLKNSGEKKRSFVQNFAASGYQKFFQRSELLKRQAEFVPSGDLIFTCTMKCDSVKKLDNTFPRMRLSDLETLSSNFKDLFSSRKKCDVVFKVKDKKFQVHKSILLARSSVFELLFWKAEDISVVSIDDCDPDSFEVFLKYLYTGKSEGLTSRNVLHLYCTAEKYCVQELKSFCVAYMLKNMTTENICDIITFAEDRGETRLFSTAQIFLYKNMVRVFSSVKWESLLTKNPRLVNRLLKELAEKVEDERISVASRHEH